MMTVYFGARPTILLNTYNVIKEAFVQRGYAFAGRPQDHFYLSEMCGGIGKNFHFYLLPKF